MSWSPNSGLGISKTKRLTIRSIKANINGVTTNNNVADLRVSNLLAGQWYRLSGVLSTRAANGELTSIICNDGVFATGVAKVIFEYRANFNTGVSTGDSTVNLNIIFKCTTGMLTWQISTGGSSATVYAVDPTTWTPQNRLGGTGGGTWICVEPLNDEYEYEYSMS
jgi:hypothetical protein